MKLRAEQVWGYLTLILGCLLSVAQFFALISPRRLDLRVFVLLVMLAAYLIRIGIRSIRLTRQSETGRQGVTFIDDLRALRATCRDLLSVVAAKLARPGITRTTVLVVFGVLHVIAGLGAFLFVGTVLLAAAHYLGIGPAAVPVMLFCLFGAVFGIVMIVRPGAGAHRAAALWDIVLGVFLGLAALAGYRFYMERFILAAILLGMAGVLMLPDMLEKPEPSNTR